MLVDLRDDLQCIYLQVGVSGIYPPEMELHVYLIGHNLQPRYMYKHKYVA